MFFEALATLLAVVGVAAASGTTSFLTARFSQHRSASLEREVIDALGLDDATSQESAASQEPKVRERDGEAANRSKDDLRNLLWRLEEQTGQRVVVHIDNSSASEALAEITKRDSDGHARLVVKYYAQGHQQAFITFIASVTFSVVGFLVVLAAAIFLLMNPNQPEPAGVISGVGLVNQGIAFLFFRRADNARNMMLGLIDKLREDREKEARFITGIVASDAIASPSLRDAVRAATAIESFGSRFTPEQLQLISKVAETAQPQTPLVNIHQVARNSNPSSARHSSEQEVPAPAPPAESSAPHTSKVAP